MDISHTKTHLIIKIPRFQTAYDAIGEEVGKTPNIVGVLAGEEMSLSQAIDMTYKGKDPQEGMPLIHFYGDKKEFLELCKTLDLNVWVHELCSLCGKTLYGSYGLGDKGPICGECEYQKCEVCKKVFNNPLSAICGDCFETA